MKLKVRNNYANARVNYPAGAVIEVDEAEARALMADSPGSFEVVGAAQAAPEAPAPEDEEKAPGAPPVDKMERGRERK